jgi:hypothetical protein
VKPHDEELVAGLSGINAADAVEPEFFLRVMEQQKRGGEINLLHLNEDGQFMWRCHRFPDYEPLFTAMLERLSEDEKR